MFYFSKRTKKKRKKNIKEEISCCVVLCYHAWYVLLFEFDKVVLILNMYST